MKIFVITFRKHSFTARYYLAIFLLLLLTSNAALAINDVVLQGSENAERKIAR
jgi:hypothetical protein